VRRSSVDIPLVVFLLIARTVCSLSHKAMSYAAAPAGSGPIASYSLTIGNFSRR
jgi:hypothetical protein